MEMNSILEDLKTQISISNFKHEWYLQKNIKVELFRFNKIAMILLTLITITGGSIFATIIHFKKFENIERYYQLGSIKDAIDGGYMENVEMDYVYSGDIGVKISSIMISDNDFDMLVDFDFNQKNISMNGLFLTYAIYDENNNIYIYNDNTLDNNKILNRVKKFYKELDIEYNKDTWFKNGHAKANTQNILTQTEENLTIQISMNSNINFPKSKNIFLRIFDIGYIDFNKNKYNSISDNKEWILRVSIPEKFHNRTNIDYKLKEEILGFTLKKAYVSSTSMTVIAKVDNLMFIGEKIKIIDQNGNEYSSKNMTHSDGIDTITAFYAINKNTVTEKLYLQVFINGDYKKVELIKGDI